MTRFSSVKAKRIFLDNDEIEVSANTINKLSNISSNIQSQLDDTVKLTGVQTIIGTKSFKNVVIEESLEPLIHNSMSMGTSNKRFRGIYSKSYLAGKDSFWLGDYVHLNTDDERVKIQIRKKIIPKYLIDNSVVEQDYINLGHASNTATIAHTQAVATSKSLSAELDVLFPSANYTTDFSTETVIDELIIDPIGDESAGLTIKQDTSNGAPYMKFLTTHDDSNNSGYIEFVETTSNTPSQTSVIASLRKDGATPRKFQITELQGNIELNTTIGSHGDSSVIISTGDILLKKMAGQSASVSTITRDSDNLELFSSVSHISSVQKTVYVDSDFSGTSNGSLSKPYSTLSAAITAKLTDSATDNIIFKLAEGVYTGTISVDKTTANQSFSIIGAGIDKTIIQGSVSWSSSTGNLLYFRDFNDISIEGLTIRQSAYGFYPRSCRHITIKNVKFIDNGANGTNNTARHKLSSTQQQQIDYWAGDQTNDGGMMRVRNCKSCVIDGIIGEYNLRGCRIQDISLAGTEQYNSIITNSKFYRNLESSIYLAASNYTGATGCNNFMVSNNTIKECSNNSILVIGGKNNTVQNNNCIDGANAGIQSWHSLDLRIINNNIFNCNRQTWNGIGNLADAFASIEVSGNTAIGTGDYMAIIQNNTTMKCNIGRSASIIGINVQRTDAGGAYPTASNKITLNNNTSDATTRFNNDNSIPILSVADSISSKHDIIDASNRLDASLIGANGNVSNAEYGYLSGVTSDIQTQIDSAGAGNPLLISSSSASTDASIELKNTASGGKTKLTISNLTSHDTQFYFETFEGWQGGRDQISLIGEQASGAKDTVFLVNKYGNICFVNANTTAPLEVGSYGVRFMNSVLFEHATCLFSNLPTADPNVADRVYVDNDKVKISLGTNTYRHETSPVGGFFQLTKETLVTLGPNNNNPTQTYRFTMPTGSNRYNGRRIEFILNDYKCTLRAGSSEWATWKYEAGSGTDHHILGGYAADSDGKSVYWNCIYNTTLSKWISSAAHNRLT